SFESMCGTPNAVKVARWVWSRGKDGDYIKVLPIAITCIRKITIKKIWEDYGGYINYWGK
ncbi:hypothetical protein COL22_30235, partial [Bacillus thuringiensis]